MNDQFGNPIPDDLVALSGKYPQDFTQKGIRIIERADWYETDDVLLVSAAATKGCDLEYCDPLDAGVNIKTATVLKVDDCLKRWSAEDGFYHA